MRTHHEIQANYIEEMRALQPELLAWWLQLTRMEDANAVPPEDIARRWPTAFSGHPRAIEVFRRHFLAVEDLNDAIEQGTTAASDDPPPATDQGRANQGPPASIVRPVDLLIHDIETAAPDIWKFVAGIVYVPVGLNQHGVSV